MDERDMDLADLASAAMMALTTLSNAARAARDEKRNQFNNDLMFAANRAWHELNGQLTRFVESPRARASQ